MTFTRQVLPGFLLAAASVAQADTISPDSVIETYGNIAQAGYEDALTTAMKLRDSVTQLTEAPSEEAMAAARQAWHEARVPYQQTEVYRFGNPLVDDWEGKVNAWPLDEGLIDYVDASYGNESEANEYYTANIIANPEVNINGQLIDATTITPELLGSELHEAGGIESNVATGYHAIEFLLWGQDLNGGEAGAGNRSYTDYDVDNCTNGNCDRRAEYLTAVTDLLISDLTYMAEAWADGGEAREALESMGETGAVAAMLTGMGSLSYGELAGERMQLGLMLHDPEEEHDCFSDNTSASHYYDGLGIQNVYMGHYQRVDGETVSGPALIDLLREKDAALAEELATDLQASVDALDVLLVSQRDGQAYDQLIAEGNDVGNALVQAAVDSLVGQTRNINRAVTALDVTGIEFEGSDSLDDPNSVFQ
ncbi:imelysin family protein [Granulosicoccus sp. 3-233]|uniref:imelysin family protein n=1 Tax=Granulosicoccus sp. 3-233 TaxID=3417969 RepID=UPI003D3478D3